MRRCKNKKIGLNFEDEDFEDISEDSLNEDYVENKRAAKKGKKGTKKGAKRAPTKRKN
jgi:hypothetical protein